MYYDNTILTFGKHKHMKLSSVPVAYLIRQYESKCYMNAEMQQYIETNIDQIIQRSQVKVLPHACDKVAYYSESDANQLLKKIRQRKQNQRIPINTYKCVRCGYWHLTSNKTQSRRHRKVLQVAAGSPEIKDEEEQNEQETVTPAFLYSPLVAQRLLEIRNALNAGNMHEAYRQLYLIASPEQDKEIDDVWNEMEAIASQFDL